MSLIGKAGLHDDLGTPAFEPGSHIWETSLASGL